MSSKQTVTVDIGIPAYNEAANIASLIDSIAKQQTKGFAIRRVILVSDGSDDDTVTVARKTGLDKLTVYDRKDRKGKSYRMDEIFRLSSADVLVLIDADVILTTCDTIANLVAPLIYGLATLTSGRPQKANTGTFTDKVMDVSQHLQDYVKEHMPAVKSLYACHGRIVGLHRDLFTKLTLPFATIGNDAYLYLFNKQHGSGFSYVPGAVVTYKMPQTFVDFAKQQRRFAATPEEQSRMFGFDLGKEYYIPIKIRAAALVSAMRFHIYALAYIVYRLRALAFKPTSRTVTWDVSASTK